MRRDYQDGVSLEIGRRVAAMPPDRPDLLVLARDNLDRWTARNRDAPGLLATCAEWRAILDRPLADNIAILTQDSDEGQRLRQNSPFPGALPYPEIGDIKRKMRSDQSAWIPSSGDGCRRA